VAVLNDELVPVRIGSVGDRPGAAWAEGLRVHLPASVVDRTGWRRAIRADGSIDLPPGPSSVCDEDVRRLRERQAFTPRPLTAALPVNYRIVPGWARAVIAAAIGRWKRRGVDRWARFPGWPLDLSADLLADLRNGALPASIEPRPAPVLVTHDIDSPQGLTRLMTQFLPAEEAAGARSTNYVVPCAWPIDHARLDEVMARGHAVGVHGCDHSNTTPFAAADERARRLDAARSFAERYHATGYRAPSLLRTRALLRDVAVRYRYDTSIPTSGGLFPTPNNGCATARPFRIEGAVELPVTMPRDGSLRFLGWSPEEIVGIWTRCADLIARSGGVVVLLTHCERRFTGQPAMFAAYCRLLEHFHERSDLFAFSTPDAVLAGIQRS